ncbi:MAG: hypothetical protein A2X94_01215 [Bdellovibrionales bacterium GWB1_55_8]|nr:MAG: hypothetical protein A2X94_01215 [Bdellovibrionales bacterium GWB1_55_8]
MENDTFAGSSHLRENSERYQVGATVVYGLHGKCTITRVETRQISGESVEFYRMEVQKSPLSRSSKAEPAIWVPVANAIDKGVRHPASKGAAASALQILSNREYYFSLKDPWHIMHPRLEAVIRQEGVIGLAKAASYLHVLKTHTAAPSRDILKMRENVNRLLLRELSDALDEPISNVESRVAVMMRRKLIPSS